MSKVSVGTTVVFSSFSYPPDDDSWIDIKLEVDTGNQTDPADIRATLEKVIAEARNKFGDESD